MKAATLALLSFLVAAAMGCASLLAGCSSTGATTTTCVDAGIDAAPTCTTVTSTGGW